MSDLRWLERLAEHGASAEQLYFAARAHSPQFDVLLRVLRMVAEMTLSEAQEQAVLGDEKHAPPPAWE